MFVYDTMYENSVKQVHAINAMLTKAVRIIDMYDNIKSEEVKHILLGIGNILAENNKNASFVLNQNLILYELYELNRIIKMWFIKEINGEAYLALQSPSINVVNSYSTHIKLPTIELFNLSDPEALKFIDTYKSEYKESEFVRIEIGMEIRTWNFENRILINNREIILN